MYGKEEHTHLYLNHQDSMVYTFSFSSLKELTSLSQVSKRFNFFFSAESLWRSCVTRDFNLKTPEGVAPKSYYRFIKEKLAKEKEIVLEYYIYRVLNNLQLPLTVVRNSKAHIRTVHLTQTKEFKLFTTEQIEHLSSDSVFNFLSSEFEKENPEITAEADLPIVQESVKNMYSKIDKGILERIKSLARSPIDAFFEVPLVPNIELPIFSSSPLFLMYECQTMTLLKVCIDKHPEAVDQLAQAVGIEIMILAVLQLSRKEEQIVDMINRSIDLLQFLLSHNISLHTDILGPNEESTTSSKLAHQFMDIMVLAKFICSQVQSKTNNHLQYNAEINTLHKPHTLKALNTVGVTISSYTAEELNHLMNAGLELGVNTSTQDIVYLDIDSNILMIMNKILDVSRKQQNGKALEFNYLVY